jgi:hypothetical protein
VRQNGIKNNGLETHYAISQSWKTGELCPGMIGVAAYTCNVLGLWIGDD